mmetsp:Transcript_5874/g.11988  ORF Transcript_5874/g.11988 Transcript_5874/m.11988 type:complete len:462 (-) Transcript_5874:788-2173(-)|eukprot:CAMPEP_0118957240 /NCGR_PEP_ID=MMETSP1169-20130426/61994_1 /TAXON_ID=36882 /ORGANISM="Pyramimonas obovata, Strain CCMP722" /LENGTH=461 /DNA_ID=CAMNT_0006905297 /DNA_START=575 /DNA_END=1960 /DNA_ORIENTATION=+
MTAPSMLAPGSAALRSTVHMCVGAGQARTHMTPPTKSHTVNMRSRFRGSPLRLGKRLQPLKAASTGNPLPGSTPEVIEITETAQREDVNFGYTKENTGAYYDVEEQGVPKNVVSTGLDNLKRESRAILNTVFPKYFLPTPEGELLRKLEMTEQTRLKLAKLELSNAAIWERERKREEEGGEVYAPWLIKVPYYLLCYMLDAIFDGRPIQRFWFLETVARTPYFSYSTMLYIYEVLGWWRRSSELRKVHFAEEWNEYHHLLIMESMGGDRAWIDRFFGQHSAVAYYLALVVLWLISPTIAYNFSELIEAHAVDTYEQFVEQNEELLKTIPAPRVAREYYEGEDMYLFDRFMTEREFGSRRVQVDTLYDVFRTIAEDEGEHVKTMAACQDEKTLFRNPTAVNTGTAVAVLAIVASRFQAEIIEALGPALENPAVASAFETAGNVAEALNVEALMDALLSLLVL